MGMFLRRKPKSGSIHSSDKNDISSDSDENTEFQKRELYKRGVGQMANDKLEDAIRSFELALHVDSKFVDAWIKKGYSHFHLAEYSAAISCYDRALEIDLNNGEAWSLKGLAYYKMKNLSEAIKACEKAIDFDPSDGMSWYNEACFLILSGKVDDGIEALKRSIEIDISYAKKAVSDRDFENARTEEGFRRIIEVVVLESIRQGYDYVGKIVWTTNMDREEVEEAISRLLIKGLIIRKEKRTLTRKEEYYELGREIADKVGETKRTGLLGSGHQITAPLQQLHDMSSILSNTKEAIEKGDLKATFENLEELINPAKHGNTMIQQFFDDHRDLRLFHIKLKDKGQEYLNTHKNEILDKLISLDSKIRAGAISRVEK